MAIIVTERRRRFKKSISKKGSTSKIIEATRIFDVTGCSYHDAADAVGSNGLTVPPYDDPHPQFDKALLQDKDVEERTPLLHTVSVTYRTDESDLEQLLDPPTVSWSYYEYSEFSDFDEEGNLYVNAAGLPFETPLELLRQGVRYQYVRWETEYDFNQKGNFNGRVNQGVAAFPGFVVQDGLAKIGGIGSAPHRRGLELCQVTYDIDIRETGHDHNVANMGAAGWCEYPPGTKVLGLFVDSGGDPVGQVRLKADGTPMEPTIKVMPSRDSGYSGDPLTPVVPPTGKITAAKLVNPKLTNSNLVVLGFKRAKKAAFGPLKL